MPRHYPLRGPLRLTDVQRIVLQQIHDAGGRISLHDRVTFYYSTRSGRNRRSAWHSGTITALLDRCLLKLYGDPNSPREEKGYEITPQGLQALQL